MTVVPTTSPWPAPSLADLVVAGTNRTETAHGAARPRRSAAALLSTAKRLSSRSERAEHAAAKEEQRIGHELDDLPAGWFVLHAVGVGEFGLNDRPIDHVVIGPGGVYAIYLEHQPGAKVWVSEHTVTINGRDSERLRETRFEARRSSRVLTEMCGFDVTVQSMLVLIGAATMQTLSRPAEVHVRTQHDLRDWLCKQPTRLDAVKPRVVHEQVRRAETTPDDSLAGLLE
ncbi:MAG: nuclease-related domain-containing protein [Ilumatobacteraceae bacterium]